jgi:nucleotide-binding universal stress UspA family protein
VLSWREGSRIAVPAERLQALNRWLMWQGVSADVREEVSDIDVADALLSRAADLGSDLIVMGAYGHTRWSEIVLGGATRSLLDSMTVPVLMSH